MSIDDAKPDEWDALKAERYHDNRGYDINDATCTLVKPMPKPYDNVENPLHYEGIIECIDYIEDRLSRDELIGYYYGSVLKYAHRWKQKGGVESLRKCRWFLNRLISTEAQGE